MSIDNTKLLLFLLKIRNYKVAHKQKFIFPSPLNSVRTNHYIPKPEVGCFLNGMIDLTARQKSTVTGGAVPGTGSARSGILS